jgi:predicted membrane channel-forming protein YqfA (hemolysin III family)
MHVPQVIVLLLYLRYRKPGLLVVAVAWLLAVSGFFMEATLLSSWRKTGPALVVAGGWLSFAVLGAPVLLGRLNNLTTGSGNVWGLVSFVVNSLGCILIWSAGLTFAAGGADC